MNQNALTQSKRIARACCERGGRAYYVGGCVRDRLMGREIQDIDIEVHGLSPETLEEILSANGGFREVGKSFGIYLTLQGGLDVALPRKERLTGAGHRDFRIEVDPHLGTERAAARRDFTVNAMMEDILSADIIDHFGGRADLERGILRHVSDDSFPEDPLRVLRGAQFAARFGFTLHPDTLSLCRRLSLGNLSCERVTEELKKALLSPAPSRFFSVLRQCDQLDPWFTELAHLIGAEQNPVYHAEGDVWTHTMMVLDEAARRRDRAEHPLPFMFAALFHDLGKPDATRRIDGALRSYDHERAGLPLVRQAMGRLCQERALLAYVLNMTELHMRPHALAAQQSSIKATHRLFDASLCPEDLILLAEADNAGRITQQVRDHTPFLTERLALYRKRLEQPQVTGADLIAAGLTPDEHFKQLLAYAHKLHLSGTEKDNALKQTLNYAKELNS